MKTCTLRPRVKTPAMPLQPFWSLFKSWPSNENLPWKELRLKAMCLLAIAFMLRPSDIAPRGVHETESSYENMIFSINQVHFKDNGNLVIIFHGIKNDAEREGFTVEIPKCPEEAIDHVAALRSYIQHTSQLRDQVPGQPVFLTLRKEKNVYKALSSSGVGKVLSEAITLAGLHGQGYSAKSFRPTGATAAVAAGCDPNVARQIGRWRSQEVFEEHYVHNKVPVDYIDKLYSLPLNE